MQMLTDEIHIDDLDDESTWIELYPRLYAYAKSFVYQLRIPCWKGQEEDLVDDVVQETLHRTLERVHKAKRGEAAPIHSLECMMRVIALNHVRDLRRHEQRVVRLSDDGWNEKDVLNTEEELFEKVTEQITDAGTFQWAAHLIANFPFKQRQALLIDLANLMWFDTEPSPLQIAFLDEGIVLQTYQSPLPDHLVGRARHASLLSCAYRRLRQLADGQEQGDAPAV